MTTFMLFAGAVLGAAVVPIGRRTGFSPLEWIKRLFKSDAVAAPVVEPPSIENDKGWKLLTSDDVDSFEDWLRKDFNGQPQGVDDKSLGSHVLIELFDCDKESLETQRIVGAAMVDAAKASEATIVTHDFHEFQPYGVSGAVIIQESHYTIHTWPEHGYAAVDLFYCGGTIYVDRAVELLKERFKPGRIKFLVVRRGIESEVAS